jgi:hypothetical protein
MDTAGSAQGPADHRLPYQVTDQQLARPLDQVPQVGADRGPAPRQEAPAYQRQLDATPGQVADQSRHGPIRRLMAAHLDDLPRPAIPVQQIDGSGDDLISPARR